MTYRINSSRVWHVATFAALLTGAFLWPMKWEYSFYRRLGSCILQDLSFFVHDDVYPDFEELCSEVGCWANEEIIILPRLKAEI